MDCQKIVDLSKEDNCAQKFAQILFGRPIEQLDSQYSYLILDEDMDVDDLFCMLIEILIYGIEILYGELDIFQLESDDHPVVQKLALYFLSCGFRLIVETSEDNLYYFCEIFPANREASWKIGNYALVENGNFAYYPNMRLELLRLRLVNHQGRVFYISFQPKFNV